MPIRKFLPHIFVALLFLGGAFIYVGGIPAVSAADLTQTTDTGYQYLAPLPKVGGTSGETVGTTMADYLSNMLKLIVAMGGVLSVFVGVVGGIEYVASGITPSAKNDAKKRIENALTGLVLVLSSYLILNSINPNLVKISFELKNVATSSATVLDTTTSGSSVSPYKVAGATTCSMAGSDCNEGYTCTPVAGAEGSLYGTCELSSTPTTDTTTSSQCTLSLNSTNYPPNSAWKDDTYERNILRGYNNITIYNNNCTTVGTYGLTNQPTGAAGCTSVCGLDYSIFAKIFALQQACASYNGSCSLVITGGTEYWLHSSHFDGKKVDFDDTTELTNYIRSGTDLGTGYGSCGYTGAEHRKVTLPNGTEIIFSYDGGTHWHACF